MSRYLVSGLRHDAIYNAESKKDAKDQYHKMYGFDIIYKVKTF